MKYNLDSLVHEIQFYDMGSNMSQVAFILKKENVPSSHQKVDTRRVTRN